MAEREDELALLGVLEASLGGRQRALAGLHVDELTMRKAMTEMIALERSIGERADEDRAHARAGPRHRRPGRVDPALVVAGALFVIALVVVLLQVW
jgi:ferric-dicitrate binding protein FerR (iron transport regulator)